MSIEQSHSFKKSCNINGDLGSYVRSTPQNKNHDGHLNLFLGAPTEDVAAFLESNKHGQY